MDTFYKFTKPCMVRKLGCAGARRYLFVPHCARPVVEEFFGNSCLENFILLREDQCCVGIFFLRGSCVPLRLERVIPFLPFSNRHHTSPVVVVMPRSTAADSDS